MKVKVQVKEKLFHEDLVYLIKKNINYIKSSKNKMYDYEFNRYYVHNDPFFVELHHMIADRFGRWVGEKVKPSYVFGSFYLDNGICPPHVDRHQCKYTLDYCVSQNEPWEIFVNDQDDPHKSSREDLMNNAKPYLLNENDGLILSGTDYWHYRNKIQKNNFCDLLFFHFVGEDFQGNLS